VTTATKSLKKEDELADGSWKYELSTQVSLFLDLVHTCLVSLGPISSELSSRIEGYRTRLKEPAPTPTRSNAIDRMSMGSIDKGDGASIRSFGTQATRTQGASEEGLRGAGTEIAGVLFGLDQDWLGSKLRELQGVCTEQAALDDFKVSAAALDHLASITGLTSSNCSNGSIRIHRSPMGRMILTIPPNGHPIEPRKSLPSRRRCSI
jgi:hypothetical protein